MFIIYLSELYLCRGFFPVRLQLTARMWYVEQ